MKNVLIDLTLQFSCQLYNVFLSENVFLMHIIENYLLYNFVVKFILICFLTYERNHHIVK